MSFLPLRSRLRLTSAWQASDDPPSLDYGTAGELAWQASDELRWASNEATLRAFRNADRFTTFKIFRRPGVCLC